MVVSAMVDLRGAVIRRKGSPGRCGGPDRQRQRGDVQLSPVPRRTNVRDRRRSRRDGGRRLVWRNARLHDGCDRVSRRVLAGIPGREGQMVGGRSGGRASRTISVGCVEGGLRGVRDGGRKRKNEASVFGERMRKCWRPGRLECGSVVARRVVSIVRSCK